MGRATACQLLPVGPWKPFEPHDYSTVSVMSPSELQKHKHIKIQFFFSCNFLISIFYINENASDWLSQAQHFCV